MRNIAIVFLAEIKKQHANNYHSYFVYCSLLLWPILSFFEVYYTYKPFSFSGSYMGISNAKELLAFLATGFMAYTCFWSMAQNAWSMSMQERREGTLEITYLTPANRIALTYGKAFGALIQEVWMFVCFCMFILLYVENMNWKNIVLLPVVFCILLFSATIWGGMLNSIFMSSRDASFILNVFDSPMVLLSGVRVPTGVFPLWAKALSCFFPLTYCLNIMRIILSQSPAKWGNNLLGLTICLILMILITVILTKKIEDNNRRTGNLQFY